jgi:hypothetical protein
MLDRSDLVPALDLEHRRKRIVTLSMLKDRLRYAIVLFMSFVVDAQRLHFFSRSVLFWLHATFFRVAILGDIFDASPPVRFPPLATRRVLDRGPHCGASNLQLVATRARKSTLASSSACTPPNSGWEKRSGRRIFSACGPEDG